MAAPHVTNFADMVAGTLNAFGPIDVISQIAQQKQRYEVLSKWFRQDRVMEGSGLQVQRSVMVSDSGAARHVQPTEEDNVNIADLMKTVKVDWVHAETSWAVVYQHTLMNRAPSEIFDAIQVQRTGSMLSLYDEMENKMWGAAPASGNTTDPCNVKYWVTNTGAGTPGFNGTYAAGASSTPGTIDPATYTNWRNYNGLYTTVSKADLIKKMRDAHYYIQFISPLNAKESMGSIGEDCRVYAGRPTVSSMEDVGESQNENLGRDIASIDGWSLLFRGCPFISVSALDADTTNPIFMLNHKHFNVHVLKGDYLRESRNTAPRQHNIEEYFVDLTYNCTCDNRRAQAVFTTS